MNKTLFSAALIVATLAAASCKKGGDSNPITPVPPTTTVKPDDIPPIDQSSSNTRIEWASTAIKLSHNVPYAEYGRIHRIDANTLILSYHCGDIQNYWDNIAVRRSTDNGLTWSEAVIVVADDHPSYYGFANPEILVMQNGWLMLSYNGKGKPDENLYSNIQVKISKDKGLTWDAPVIAARGRSWEPAMVQLPDGEIQLFYSSEAKWWINPNSTPNPEQEILLIRSKDNGTTWTSPVTVAYAAGNRDGMPVPLILQDNKGIVFPIESVRDSQSPYILWSSMDASWNYAGVGSINNQRRWLARQGRFGGAPYLIQLNTKETILSCQ
ncbi:MAG: exo-alpha-sialidase, partial [Sphingobacteriales bacterium]